MAKLKKKVTVFGFFSLTATMVWTVYEYPTFATAKLNLLFFVILGGFFWFMPVALISAEMASVENWDKGGIFTWVAKTLGNKFGLAAICFEWFQAVIAFITMCYFIIGALSDILYLPILNNNLWIKFALICLIFWTITLIQFRGIYDTVKLSKLGMMFGIVIPTIVFSCLAIIYLCQGHKLQITFSWNNFIPDFRDLSTLVVAASFVLAFGGIEASAAEVKYLNNPKRNYPIVIIMLALATILLDGIGGLSVASVIPVQDLSLSTGVIQAFRYLFAAFFKDSEWLVVLFTLGMILGVLAQISSWITGPTTTLRLVAKKQILPKYFAQENQNKVPTRLLITQGIIVTIIAFILTFGAGSGNVSFFVAVSLTSVIYLCAYILMFIAYLVYLFKYNNLKHDYEFTKSKVMKIIVAIVGLIISVITFFVAFAKPSALTDNQGRIYQKLLLMSFMIMFFLPFIIYYFQHHKITKKD